MTDFSKFNSFRAITKVTVTEGYTNQTTGAWIPESTSETAINAHIADISLKERQYLDPGIIEKGSRKLICEATLNVGDRIKVTETDTSVTEWLVNSKLHESNLLKQYVNISRTTYLLVKK